VLPLGVEFDGLLKRLGRIVQFPFCKVQLAARLIGPGKLRINGQRALDSRIGFVKSPEFYKRAGRQTQEICVVRVLIEPVGANGFGRLDLAALQELLCFLESLCYFLGNCRSPDCAVTTLPH